MFISSYSDKITKKSNEIKHAKNPTPKLCFCRRQRCTTASRNPCKQRKSLMRMRSWGKPTSYRPSSLLPSWILRSLFPPKSTANSFLQFDLLLNHGAAGRMVTMRDLSGACLSSVLNSSELYKWRSSFESLEESDKRGDSPISFLNCSMP